MNLEFEKMTDKMEQSSKSDINQSKIDIDSPVEPTKGKEISDDKSNIIDKCLEVKDQFYTEYTDRLNYTPVANGEWTGDRGESKFKTFKSDVKQILEKFGIDGIEYKNAVPDFSPVTDTSVQIDMTQYRYSTDDPTGKNIGNFQKADEACAKKWNEEGRDGKIDWTSKDVKTWRKENKYTWHECNDTKTCQLVPIEIHEAFPHVGGCKECEMRDSRDGKKDNVGNDVFDKLIHSQSAGL